MTKQVGVHVPMDLKKNHPNIFALEVEGNCMAPTVMEGEVIIVDPDIKPRGNAKDIAAVELYGNRHLCRYFVFGNEIVLLKDNDDHKNLVFLKKHVKIIGTVIWIVGIGDPNEKNHHVGDKAVFR